MFCRLHTTSFMWSRAARAASSARAFAADRSSASERAPLVAPARDGGVATTREEDDRDRGFRVGVAPSSGDAPDDGARPSARTRSKAAHLVPGIVALLACAVVLWVGSLFVEHPLWRFEHVSRWAARREAATGAGEAMRCRKDSSLTGTEACLPSFAVIGSHIGGVRRLKTLMSQHDMLTDLQKTVHFFNPVYGAAQGVQMCEPNSLLLKAYFSSVLAGRDAWSPYDPAQTMRRKRDGEPFERELGDVVSGDWSDTYFNCACCAATMKKLMPELRPIVVLRDPIGRAMARYVEENHPHGTPVEAAGLSACALKENGYTWGQTAKKTKTNLQQCLREAADTDASTVTRECLDYHSFLGWSLYAEYLELWLKEFPDLLVLYTDDIQDNPEQVARTVEKYLGLPESMKPYDTSRLGAQTGHFASVSYDLQPQLSRTDEDREATEELLEFFRPHVMRLHEMSKKGKIPALPYMWQRRYNIQNDAARGKARRLLSDDVTDSMLGSSMTTIDDALEDIDSHHKKSKKHGDDSEAARTMDIEDVLGAIGNTIAAEDESHASNERSAESLKAPAESSEIEAKKEAPAVQAGASDEDATFLESLEPTDEYADNGDDAAAIGAGNSKTNNSTLRKSSTDAATSGDVDDLKVKSEKLQERAEEKAANTKPTWKANTVRGRFYSDLYVPMDESIRDDLKGNVFVPLAVPYLFQFANEFKHNNAWMDIIGIKKEEQARVYSDLWRDDCTHSQQWSGENGCCGEACCFVGGHRREIVGFRG